MLRAWEAAGMNVSRCASKMCRSSKLCPSVSICTCPGHAQGVATRPAHNSTPTHTPTLLYIHPTPNNIYAHARTEAVCWVQQPNEAPGCLRLPALPTPALTCGTLGGAGCRKLCGVRPQSLPTTYVPTPARPPATVRRLARPGARHLRACSRRRHRRKSWAEQVVQVVRCGRQGLFGEYECVSV